METPHDDLFQLVFSDPENAVGELQHLLPPEVSERIDWATLSVLPVSFIGEELSRRRADVAFSVKLGGREVVLYLLLEHQSTTDPLMALRLLRYMVRLWDEYIKVQRNAKRRPKRLPAIVPMVVHHSKKGWKAPRRFQELLDLDPASMESLGPLQS